MLPTQISLNKDVSKRAQSLQLSLTIPYIKGGISCVTHSFDWEDLRFSFLQKRLDFSAYCI